MVKKLLLSFLTAIVGTIIFSEGKGLLTTGILRPAGTLSDALRFITGEAEVTVTVFLGMGIALLTGIVITAILMAQKITWRKGLSLLGIHSHHARCCLGCWIKNGGVFCSFSPPPGGLLARFALYPFHAPSNSFLSDIYCCLEQKGNLGLIQ